jgi:hypothetical protein
VVVRLPKGGYIEGLGKRVDEEEEAEIKSPLEDIDVEFSEDFKVVLQEFLGKLLSDPDKFHDLLTLYLQTGEKPVRLYFEYFLKFYIDCLEVVYREFGRVRF